MLGRLNRHCILRSKLYLAALVTVVLSPLGVPLGASAVTYSTPVERYAPYQPQTTCRATARPGTKVLARWVDRKFAGGKPVASVRRCKVGGTSEHKEGRAIDWPMQAARKAHRIEVRRFLKVLFAADADGNPAAAARRMGVMYVIWNDHIYASYDQFAKRDYTPCTPLSTCSATARHRDHVHISLSRAGGKGITSWYAGRL